LHTVIPDPSVREREVGVPLMSQDNVADVPAAMVAGDAVRLNVNGTVTATVMGADVPAGPVAVRV
jgi:hypothetical protein